MNYFAIFLLFCTVSFASEHSAFFVLQKISMQDALWRFNTQIIPPTGTTVSQQLARDNITLSFNRENNHILMRGTNEQALHSTRELIQAHIDRP